MIGIYLRHDRVNSYEICTIIYLFLNFLLIKSVKKTRMNTILDEGL
jgi:hypothetical protein